MRWDTATAMEWARSPEVWGCPRDRNVKWAGRAYRNGKGKSPVGVGCAHRKNGTNGVRCAHQNKMGKRPNWVGCAHQSERGRGPKGLRCAQWNGRGLGHPFRMEYARGL